MRRLPTLMLAFYLIFLGGSAYYSQLFLIRIAHHAIMTMLLVIWLIVRIRRGVGLPRTPYSWLLTALVGVWLISAAFALDPRIAFESAWFPITHVLIFFYITALFQAGRGRVVMETVFLIGTVIVVAAVAQIITWLTGWLPLLSSELPFPPILPRLDQPFGVTTWLGAFAAPLILIAVAWALTVRRRDYRPPLWGLAAALTLILILTTSRGSFVALGVSVSVLVALRLWNRPSLNRLIPVGFAALVGVGILGGVIFLISRDASRVGGDVLRVDLWTTAVEAAKDDPLTGVGVGMFGRAHRTYRDPSYVDDRLGTAHNLYLNTTAETGILGLSILIALAVVGVRLWWQQWRNAESDGRRLRLEAAGAALIGFAVQSLFDTFTLTNTILLPLVLIAYISTPTRTAADPPVKGSQIMAGMFAILLLGFGVGLAISDRAQSLFDSSVRMRSLESVEEAQVSDPYLRLYELQRLYLIATDPSTGTDEAIRAYEQAVTLEPTWDTGWINLTPLYVRVDDIESAHDALERAATISNWNGAWFGWAYLSEQYSLASPDEITDAYARSIISPPTNREFWTETPIREAAILQYAESQPLEIRYRTYAAIFPDRAAALVPVQPETAIEWWIAGHHALTILNDATAANTAFTHAIQRDPARGDFYVWRALARRDDAAESDRALVVAERLGTTYDSLLQTRIELADTPEMLLRLRIQLVGSRYIDQNFEGVLFQGRRAEFYRVSEWSGEPPTTEAAAVWFDLAYEFATAGDRETAAQVLRLFLAQYPSNIPAREQLTTLEGSP